MDELLMGLRHMEIYWEDQINKNYLMSDLQKSKVKTDLKKK